MHCHQYLPKCTCNVKQKLKSFGLLLTLRWHLLPPPSRLLASGHLWLVVGNRASPVPLLLLLKSGIIAIEQSEERGWNLSLKFYWADNSRLLQIHWVVSKGARAATETYNTDIVQELLKTAQIHLASQQTWAPSWASSAFKWTHGRWMRCWTGVILSSHLSVLDTKFILNLILFFVGNCRKALRLQLTAGIVRAAFHVKASLF